MDQRILSVRRRTECSDKSLLTTMSLVESKRGIAEAESVTRLTELAFFFIPLTFSATVFSMQVKELNASVTPISTFIILAASITIGSYAQRLAMHNAWIWKRMRFITEELVPRTSEIKSAVQIFFWSLYYRCTRWCGLLLLKRTVCEMPCIGLP